ncbi:IclR family transcriptional regulator [Thalassospira sp.]|uniref:IclR family transcriptional regulator n=1 Tax=Thalassospira sp. TaxID=1912094 RepID=UPI0027370E95|nr:IclR family transcriptional regulator [Thalassospira sp.]MDP2696867.1 IclR family transcriptional regulator [Thalassospira sp.]
MTTKRARGLDRAFDILDCLMTKKGPMRPNEIATAIDAPKSSIYEIVNLLLESNVLERSGAEGQVFLGRRLYFWGRGYLNHFDLAREGREHLQYLAEKTRETAQLCMLEGQKYTVIMMNEGSRHFRISADVGEIVPIPWTASGRLLVGHLSDQEILDFIPAEDFILPSGSKLPPEEFIAQVRKATRENFFAFDSIADNYTHCFAAPVYDDQKQCIATLCLITPRVDGIQHFDLYKHELTTRAELLTRQLGGHTANATAV